MPILRIIITLFLFFATSVLIFANDRAFSFFVEACRHSGYNPAEIASFQAELTLTTQSVHSGAILEAFVKRETDAMESAMRREGKSEAEIKRAKEEHANKIRPTLANETYTRTIKAYVRNSASPIGLEDARPLILERGIDNQMSYLFASSLGTTPDEESRANIRQFTQSTTVQTSGGGDAWYATSGRMPLSGVSEALGRLLSRDDQGNFSIDDVGVARFKRFCEEIVGRTFSLSTERVNYEGEHFAYVLHVYDKGVLRDRYLIDPDRGYICPSAQFFDRRGNGRMISETVAEDFIFDEHSQKWFPSRAVHSSWSGVEGNIPRMVREFRIIPGTLVLNQPIPDSVFALTVREGTRVDDVRRDDLDKITFIASQEGKLDLPTVDEKSLDDIPWLVPSEVVQYPEPHVIEKASFNWKQIVLTAIGIILIVVGLTKLFLKKSEA